jgi:ArsR family transcriptional regulator, cadmium/lead-responsive transcriptional repressor
MTSEPDDELWSAVADPSRRRVLDLLVRHGDASASWLAGQVPFSRQAVSKHLAVLEQVGLISRRKQGREVLYQVDADRLDQATSEMAELARQWDRRLDTLKRLAESAHHQAKERNPDEDEDTSDRLARGVGGGAPTAAREGEGADPLA